MQKRSAHYSSIEGLGPARWGPAPAAWTSGPAIGPEAALSRSLLTPVAICAQAASSATLPTDSPAFEFGPCRHLSPRRS
eukprot:9129363-Pyramimonas_sp.AAC.1